MAMWKNDDEMFALMKEKLYTPVVGDILDQMGYKHQFLPAAIRPLAAQVPTAPYILPGETEDKRLKLAGYACTVLENDVYEYQTQKPFGYMTEALDDLKPNEIYIATGAHNSALWGELLTACGNDSPKMVITTQNGITTYEGKFELERYIEAHIRSDG